MIPTNKLRWRVTPPRRGTPEEIEKLSEDTGISLAYSQKLHERSGTRVLQQWWSASGQSQDVRGEWRNIPEVEVTE